MSILRYKDPVTGKAVPIPAIRGDDGNQMFVRYSVYPDGTDMSETWDETMVYMGIALAPVNAAPTDKAAYQWIRASSTKTFKGSYVGTGVSGSSKANSLTFDFAPTLLFIQSQRQMTTDSYVYMPIVEFAVYIPVGSGGYMHRVFRGPTSITYQAEASVLTTEISNLGRTITWYTNTEGSGEQMNVSGVTYYYTAIG